MCFGFNLLNINSKKETIKMALTSPGVQVSVIDESFYTTAEPGTRPLFVVATGANKSPASGSGTALGTVASNAGKVYTITSQRELAETFGDPVFKVDTNNNPIFAGELNEYGLQAAYSFLGVSNSALVVRANLDLNELLPRAEAPGGEPTDGTFWLDTANSSYGIFQWDGRGARAGGQSFTNKLPLVFTDSITNHAEDGTAAGTYAVAVSENVIGMYYKSIYNDQGATAAEGDWVLVGSNAWVTAWPTISQTTGTLTNLPTSTISINGVNVEIAGGTIASVVANINASDAPCGARTNSAGLLEIFAVDTANDALTITEPVNITYEEVTTVNNDVTDTGATGAKFRVVRNGDQSPAYTSVTLSPGVGNGGIDYTEGDIIKILGSRVGGVNVTHDIQITVNGVSGGAITNFTFTGTADAGGTLLNALGINPGAYATPALTISKHTQVPQYKAAGDDRPTGSVWIKTTEPNAGQRWRVKLYNSATKLWEQLSTPVYATEVAATTGIDPTGLGTNIKVNTVYVEYDNTPVAEFVVKRRNTTSTWLAMPVGVMYFISDIAPTTLTADGTLWYSSVVDEVDILVNGLPGDGWMGYRSVFVDTNEDGPIVSATAPTTQTDTGHSPLADGDLWIDTSDLEHYPLLKRWNDSFKRWDLVDVTDQTTDQGIVFADARWSGAGSDVTPDSIRTLLTYDFVDTDAPDPDLYPQGMLLWNTRRSGVNVKKFVRNFVDTTADNARNGGESMSNYYPHRWVTESGNQTNGSGSFGRHAQRKVVIQALQALVNNNEQIRDTERNSFNLLATPGYPELIGEMVNLNYDRGLTAFVVGDSPARLNPSATELNNWGTNLMGSLQDDDNGLVSFDEYLGVFYPWGFTSDNMGRDIAVPPSHMILRTIALNDQIAYPWFAPAGTRRGNITNATAVGYVTGEGEFSSVALNDGQRDTLYNVKVNPITYFTGAGLVNFGQKTRAKGARSLDRINVARLVIFLRNQLNKLAKPYIFEPNDKITRDEVKQQVESLLLELVGQRALYDFLVVCDDSNNTPNRIDRSELHVDIAIEPVKAVEFIYIPIRLKNTGEIAGLGK
jgi:hypothetical protein